jgi:hypothetical protein
MWLTSLLYSELMRQAFRPWNLLPLLCSHSLSSTISEAPDGLEFAIVELAFLRESLSMPFAEVVGSCLSSIEEVGFLSTPCLRPFTPSSQP